MRLQPIILMLSCRVTLEEIQANMRRQQIVCSKADDKWHHIQDLAPGTATKAQRLQVWALAIIL